MVTTEAYFALENLVRPFPERVGSSPFRTVKITPGHMRLIQWKWITVEFRVGRGLATSDGHNTSAETSE
jgi:hypothetical protein